MTVHVVTDTTACLPPARAREAGVTVVPLHAALQARGWKAMLTDFAADWFHPNDRGHRVWADAFSAAWTGPPSRSDGDAASVSR